jgi:hypothetical protein
MLRTGYGYIKSYLAKQVQVQYTEQLTLFHYHALLYLLMIAI